jgi:hypothetical protein
MAKETEILVKRICLSATLFTTRTSMGSNPEQCGDRTTPSSQSHATACHIIFGSTCIYRKLFSRSNFAVLLHTSLSSLKVNTFFAYCGCVYIILQNKYDMENNTTLVRPILLPLQEWWDQDSVKLIVSLLQLLFLELFPT